MDIIKEFLANPEVQSALGTLILALAGFIATALSSATVGLIKSKTTAAQFEQLQLFAIAAVHAAEQGALSGFVTDKKASAINVVNGYLQSAGITSVSAADIDAAIEAAVLRSFNAYKTQPAVSPFGFPFPMPEPTPPNGVDDLPPEEGNG